MPRPPAIAPDSPHEWIEDPVEHVPADADARIAHHDNGSPVLHSRGDGDFSALGRVARSVRQQVGEDLLKAIGVAADPLWGIRRDVDLEILLALFHARSGALGRRQDRILEAQGLPIDAQALPLKPRHVGEIVDDFSQSRGRPGNQTGRTFPGRFRMIPLEHGRRQLHVRQRLPELVRDERQGVVSAVGHGLDILLIHLQPVDQPAHEHRPAEQHERLEGHVAAAALEPVERLNEERGADHRAQRARQHAWPQPAPRRQAGGHRRKEHQGRLTTENRKHCLLHERGERNGR